MQITDFGVVRDDTSQTNFSQALPYQPAPPVLVGAVMVTLVATPAAATAVIVGALGGLHRMLGCIQVSGRDPKLVSDSRQPTRLCLAPSNDLAVPPLPRLKGCQIADTYLMGAVRLAGLLAGPIPTELTAYA